MLVTRKELKRLNEKFFDSHFMAQRRVWHLTWQRMRDVGRGETKEIEHVVIQCKVMHKKSHGRLESGQRNRFRKSSTNTGRNQKEELKEKRGEIDNIS